MLNDVRQQMRARILAAAEADPRIIAVLDYGSNSEGRDDQWPQSRALRGPATLPEQEQGARLRHTTLSRLRQSEEGCDRCAPGVSTTTPDLSTGA